MRPDRLIAFTDGVIAILITILVLELRPPAGEHFGDLLDEKGRLLAYLLTFVFVAIYWVNHHHLLQVVDSDRRARAVGEHRAPVLPLADAGRDRLARRDRRQDRPGCHVRARPARLRDRLHAAHTSAARAARVRVAAAPGDRRRPQRKAVASCLRRRVRARVVRAVDLGRHLRDRRADLDHSRPPDHAHVRLNLLKARNRSARFSVVVRTRQKENSQCCCGSSSYCS